MRCATTPAPAVGNNRKFLRNEVNVLKLLECAGFGDRVPPILGIVQHEGSVRDLVRAEGGQEGVASEQAASLQRALASLSGAGLAGREQCGCPAKMGG